MHWYSGGISEAVATSKAKNAIFVVYVEGKDDNSKNLTSIINDVEVSSKLQSDNFVALKLEAGSIPHNQFAEIYKNVPIPSIFFIGKVGLPLDIVTNVPTSQDLLNRIENVIAAHEGASPNSSASSQSFINEEKNTQSSSSNVNVTKSETAISPEIPVQNESLESKTSESNDSMLSKEEKLQRAKELVEKKREEKKLEEQEKERLKELERRKLGQEVQKLKEWQKDQELKDLLEKRKKEKNEDKAARDRILAQIQQDKADRAARFGTAQNLPQTEVKTDSQTKANVVQPNSARLQFKLPDGSTSTNSFENFTTLQEVRNYIIDNLNLPFRNFTLATTFPRHEFTSDDTHSTLLELGLCPTSVMLVIPSQSSVTLSRQPRSPIGLIWLLFSPIISIWGYVRSLVFGAPRNNSTGRQETPRNVESSAENKNTTSATRKMSENSVVRRHGNIHRLTDRSDSDDDNNTWNGNSTQQM